MIDRSIRLQIEESVNRFRNEHGFSSSEAIQLSGFLMKNDVTVAYVSLSEMFDGMTIRTLKGQKFMLINRDKIIGRQHFTIGHEIYHLFIQKEFTPHKCKTGYYNKQKDIEEQKADYFAACLLLPEAGILQLIPDDERKKNTLKDSTIFKIQQYYRLSINAVITRLIELGYIDKTYYDKFQGNIKAIAKKLGYDMYLFEKRNEDKFLSNYATMANELFQNRKISESYYFELLNAVNIDPLDIEEDGIQ